LGDHLKQSRGWAFLRELLYLVQYRIYKQNMILVPPIPLQHIVVTRTSVIHLTLRSDSSSQQGNEILWKYEVEMLKTVIIIIGYTLNNFITHITIL
jgi:hypothetical protein